MKKIIVNERQVTRAEKIVIYPYKFRIKRNNPEQSSNTVPGIQGKFN